MMTPGFPGRPRSLEPAVVLALAGVVSRACRLLSFCTGAGHSSQPVTVVLMSGHLETLGVHCRVSPFAAASSTSTRIVARCCHRSNAPGGLTTQWICLMHVCTVHVNRAAREGVTGSQRPPRRHCQHRPEHRRLAHLKGWTHDAVQEIATMHHNTAAWSNIVCTDAKRADVLAFATPRHIAGTVFMHHSRRVALELRPIVAEDPPVPDAYPRCPSMSARSRGCARGGAHSCPEPLLSTSHRTVTGCDAYPPPVPHEKSLQARDTTPARVRTFAGSSARPRKPGVVTVSHQPTTPQHTQRSLAVKCVTTHSK